MDPVLMGNQKKNVGRCNKANKRERRAGFRPRHHLWPLDRERLDSPSKNFIIGQVVDSIFPILRVIGEVMRGGGTGRGWRKEEEEEQQQHEEQKEDWDGERDRRVDRRE